MRPAKLTMAIEKAKGTLFMSNQPRHKGQDTLV